MNFHEEIRRVGVAARDAAGFFTRDKGRWTQVKYRTDDGTQFCAIGAMYHSPGGGNTLDEDFIGSSAQAVGVVSYTEYGNSVIIYNDTPGRVVDDIIELLTDMADGLDELADWQAELDGFTPMVPIIVGDRIPVYVSDRR